MKTLASLALCLFMPFVLSMAQYVNREVDHNKAINELSQQAFDNDARLVTVNNVFVKSTIGINLDSIQDMDAIGKFPFVIKGINEEKDSLVVAQVSRTHPIVINGATYGRIFNFTFDKMPELIALEDVKRLYHPEITEDCIYMINRFFITKDVDSYKIDKDFILKTEVVKSDEFEALKNHTPFTILKIYTKTRENLSTHNVKRLGST